MVWSRRPAPSENSGHGANILPSAIRSHAVHSSIVVDLIGACTLDGFSAVPFPLFLLCFLLSSDSWTDYPILLCIALPRHVVLGQARSTNKTYPAKSFCVFLLGAQETITYFPPSHQVFQGFFAAIVTCQFVVATVHWTTNLYFFLHVLPKRQRYPSLMKHGILFVLIVLEGRYYCRIPLRSKHLLFPLSMFTLYGSWTVFQSFFGPSNPFFYGQERVWNPFDDDAVYPQMNWSKRPIQTSWNWLLCFVSIPAHFYFLWIIFCWSGKGTCFDGSNHYFKEKRIALQN
jgi:hypothetical protein